MFSSPCNKPSCSISPASRERIASPTETKTSSSPSNASRNLCALQLVCHPCIHSLFQPDSTILEFDRLKLTKDERLWLEKRCPYFKPSYLDYLEAYRFKPEQLHLEFVPLPEDASKYEQGDPATRGHVNIDAVGPWQETILWEVPLMACLSEIYFTTTDQDWDYEGQEGSIRLLLFY